MRRAKGVVFTFIAARKSGQATELAQAAHALASTGQYLVRIGLVPHIPYKPVIGRIKNVVQRHCQLDRTQVGTEMPPGLGDAVKHVGTQFVGQHSELDTREAPQISRTVDGFEQ